MNRIALILISACIFCSPPAAEQRIDSRLLSNDGQVLVVAHRGCWGKAPENSIKAIEDCILMGVDVVELDVRRTRDGQLVLMHDTTIDRTTSGAGMIRDITLHKLKKYYLRNRAGGNDQYITNLQVPTLREALLAARDRVLINVDAKDKIRADALEIAAELGVTRQIIIKSADRPDDNAKQSMPYIGKTHYMPVIREGGVIKKDEMSLAEDIDTEDIDALSKLDPVAYEIVFKNDHFLFDVMKIIQANTQAENGARIWVNTLHPALCGNRDESTLPPDDVWGFFIRHGVTMIQTDRPQALIGYLYKRGLGSKRH